MKNDTDPTFRGTKNNNHWICDRKVDDAESIIDVIFLHFFVLEFVLRVVALGVWVKDGG